MPLAGILSGREQRSNADFRLYLLMFTKAATVCDSTEIPMHTALLHYDSSRNDPIEIQKDVKGLNLFS